jgi:hypothetical protein
MVLVLALLVLAVHNVGYMFSQSYWNDEDWVAVSTKYPLSALRFTTSSTPIGWSFLLRLVTIDRTESGRVLPLAFAVAAVAVAYWLVRRLDWKRQDMAVVAGVLGAVALLIVPAMLVRDDLKQYTADAFMALVVLALTSRLERQWSRAGLVLLAVATIGGMFFSDAAVFVGATAWAAIWLVQLCRRSWRRLAEVTAVGLLVAGFGLAVFEAFDTDAVKAKMIVRYGPYFVPWRSGLTASLKFIGHLLEVNRPYFGLGHYWFAVPLVIVGFITLFRLGRPAMAIAIFLLWPEMIALSALKKYPLLDLRTSTFLVTSTVLVAAIGVAGICAVLRERLQGGKLPRIVAIAVAVLAVAGFSSDARPYVRSEPIPVSDMREMVQYVSTHAGPKDPIFLSADSNWGFAYYWPTGVPGRRLNSDPEQGYQAYFPDQPRIVVAPLRTLAGINVAMRQALSQIQPGTCGRIWMVLSQLNPVEVQSIPIEMQTLGLTRHYVMSGLYYINVGPASCQS